MLRPRGCCTGRADTGPVLEGVHAMRRCSWCDEPATVVLVSGGDHRYADHDACPTHEEQWGRLYRRTVRLRAEDAVLDLRDASGTRRIS